MLNCGELNICFTIRYNVELNFDNWKLTAYFIQYKLLLKALK